MKIIGDISRDEIKDIVERAEREHKGKVVSITVDGDFVDVEYELPTGKFSRLRRITGYLTNDLEKWNDAKRAEEKDRVKHGIDNG